MRKLFLSLVGLIVFAAIANAGKVTKQQALQKAQQLMRGRNLTPANVKSLSRGQTNDDAFYIFNAENKGGYIIVSADDRTVAILGYSDRGTINAENIPENMRIWLQGYADQISALPDGYQSNSPHKTRAANSAIEPLIQTTWNQSTPYNLMCPFVSGQYCVTGCVATALAQVMYYYKWPETSPVLPAYSTYNELPATTFKWEKMKLDYRYDETGESADAVAELLRYCGQINEMNYGVGASASYLHINEVISLFNYSKNIRSVSRSGFTNIQWEDMIYKELEEKRPVLYDGQSSSGDGHMFICDGYDGNGLFHINWGWGGDFDGYYVLSLADPYEKGIGGGNGSDGFSLDQCAVLGFKPATENEALIPQMSSYSANVSTPDYSRSSASQEFVNVELNGQIAALYNGVPETVQSVETGWGLCKDGTLLSCLGYDNRTIPAASYSYVSNVMTLSFGNDLEDGKYQLCQIFRMPGDSDWKLCDNSGACYLVAEISETALTLRSPDINTVDFTVNSISYSEDPEKDSPVVVTVNITNTSETVSQNVYFWIQVDGQWKKVASNSSSVDPDCSGDVSMSFTPSLAGTFDVKVTADSGGSEVKGTGSLTIADIGQVTLEGITYTYNMLSKKAKVTGVDSETIGEDVVIPSSIADGGVEYSVTAIVDGAFANANNIESLVISEGVKSIGNRAFWYIYNLQKLDLPSTLIQIDEYAFASCSNLSSVIVRMAEPFPISDNVFCIINWATGVETHSPSPATLYVPTGTTSKYQATAGWKEFQTMVEGEIKEVTFNGLTYSYLTGPKTATLIKAEITDPDVTIPASITVDGVHYSVKAIDNAVFRYNGNIVNLVVSEGVETIGETVFLYCYNLKTVDLPSTLKQIGDKAFGNCSRLSKVVVRMTDPFAISDIVFYVSQWNDGVETMLPSPATLCVPVGTTSKYQTTAGWKEFQTMVEGDIKEVTIDGLTYSCVTGPKTATVIKAEISDPDLTIPASITVDGASYAVKAIANSVLTYNNSVVNLVVSEGVETIGEMAFLYCYNLKTVDLPSTLKQIGDKAFSGYNKLSKVVVRMAEPFAISDNVFLVSQWNDGVETIIPSPATLCVPVGTTSKYQTTAGWKEFQSMVEGDIKEVTLDGMTYSYVTGPKTATIIKGEFSGSDLAIPSSITIDGVSYSVTAIGNKAFSSNYDIVNLVVPEGIETIGEMAFIYCNKLETVDLPSTLKQLDDKAFGSCYSLSKAVVRMTEPFAISDNVFGISNWSGSVETIVPSYATLYVPKGCVNVYGNTDGWNFADIVEIDPDDPEDPDDPSTDDPSTDDPSTDDPSTDDPSTDDPSIDESIPDEVSVTITSALQVPYCSKYSLDFTDKPELKAYVATGYDKAKGTIWLTRVKQVPAETGFLLLGDAGDYDIPTIDGVSDVYYKNMFKGTLEGTTIQTTDGEYTNYYLSKGTSGVGFYKVTNADGQKIGANRCYLPILTDIPANGAEGDAEVIKVSAAKQVPYYTSKNIDFTSLDAQGVKAYTATGYNYKTGIIWLTRVKKVPAQTGILVMADKEGEYSVPTISVQSIYENMFTGSEAAQTIYTSETVGDIEYINYYLSNGTSGVGFYKVTNENGQKMGANRSYLQIPYRATSGARGMGNTTSSFSKMVISDDDDDVIAIPVFGGDATGISDVHQRVEEQEVYYNLQGLRVDKPGKGVFIRNGKKVVIK